MHVKRSAEKLPLPNGSRLASRLNVFLALTDMRVLMSVRQQFALFKQARKPPRRRRPVEPASTGLLGVAVN